MADAPTAAEGRRRIGVFGGTFDPVHLGHLVLAEQCREQGGLDEVWFVPAGVPPHKQAQEVTRFEQRGEMIELAIAGNPAFRVEPNITGERGNFITLRELGRTGRPPFAVTAEVEAVKWRTDPATVETVPLAGPTP